MTHLEAELLDLTLSHDGLWAIFKIGKCEDFHETIEELKSEITFNHRDFDPDRKTWAVRLTPRTEAALGDIFDNFAGSIEAIRSQRKLWND